MPIITISLEQRLIEKAGAIAAHLERQAGTPVSRSAAVALLIDRFLLPGWSTDATHAIDQGDLSTQSSNNAA